MKKIEAPISVVIATLGGDVLNSTIAHISQGEVVPSEILVCIPEAVASNADCLAVAGNVRIIKCPSRGQVAQRAVGLGMAVYPFVMQLDDDVILPSQSLRILYEILLEKGEGNIIAPFFRAESTGEGVTHYPVGFRGLIRNCHASLVCGAPFGRKRMGTISPAGIGFGLPIISGDPRVVELEWLPGGAVLCHKVDLITHNYYPFTGKAFSEDLIHSLLWRKQGCRLWISQDAIAITDVTMESFAWSSVANRYRAHTYVASLSGGAVWRTRFWFAFYCLWNIRKLIACNYFHK